MKNNKRLIGILIVAAVIRFVGIYPGYNQFHPDEQMSYATAAAMVLEKTLVPQDAYAVKYAYPYLVPLVNYFFFQGIFVPVMWCMYFFHNIIKIIDGFIQIPLSVVDASRIFRMDILGYRYVNTIFWARTITAFFGIGNVFLLYRIGKHIYSKPAGLIAALLLTFNYRQVSNSHIALPDIYNSFFLLLAVYTTLLLYHNPTGKRYLQAGLAAAVAFNVKFQFFVFFPFVVTHLMIALKSRDKIMNRLIHRYVLIACFFTPLVTLIVNPFHFINFEETSVQVIDVALKYGMGTKQLNLFPFWYMYTIDLGAPLFILALLGMIYTLKARTRYGIILASLVSFQCFIFFYYSSGGFHIRNIIPITPTLIIFAAILLDAIRKRLPFLVFVPVLAVVLYIPARNSVINAYYSTKPWNFSLLTDWLNNNPLDGPLASNPTDPPTGTPPIVRTDFNLSTHYSIAEHKESGALYALINTDWSGNDFYSWMVHHPGSLSEKWNKPIDKLRASYYGLALEEMLRYQIFAATKPWQAPDANLILFQLPDWSSVATKNIYSHNAVVSQEDRGTIAIANFPAKGNHLYKVNAVLKPSGFVPLNRRDGFIKLKLGNYACVSSRAYSQKIPSVTFYCLSPQETSRGEVSLQVENAGTNVMVDNLTVEESKDAVTIIPGRYPYIENDVELELLYPNSQANL